MTIDLGEVTFIDSTGVWALTRIEDAAQRSGVVFRAVNATVLLDGAARRPQCESAAGDAGSMTVDRRRLLGPVPHRIDATW